MSNVIVYTNFINEKFPLIIEYEQEGDCILILSVRLTRRVVDGGEIYARTDGAYRIGPVYEAVWLHGHPGVDNILSPKQLVLIAKMVAKELHNPGQVSIPEESIVYLEKYYGKP